MAESFAVLTATVWAEPMLKPVPGGGRIIAVEILLGAQLRRSAPYRRGCRSCPAAVIRGEAVLIVDHAGGRMRICLATVLPE